MGNTPLTIDRPFVMSIAGLDPSGGAGLLADIKTFEANKVYGFGVCSALTVQNDVEFGNVKWVNPYRIIEQINILYKRAKIDHIKIGLIESHAILLEIVTFLKMLNPEVFITWDPILKATAGNEFQKTIDTGLLEKIFKKIDLVTPNIPEIQVIYPAGAPDSCAKGIAASCAVYLKGGHARGSKTITDTIYIGKNKTELVSEKFDGAEKHGSGCVLSAAITANKAKGLNLIDSCKEAKKYIDHYLASNTSLLGFHNF